ncbi:hypothetical protein Peur_072644 [Populus x canadensis]
MIMTTTMHEGVCDQKRCWSDLPGDMVALIISRLRAPDCYRFVSVCKSWSSIPLPKFKKEFPTLVYLKSDGQLINFFSPLLCCSTPEIANSVYKNIITSDTTKFSSDIEDNEHDQCCQKGESDRSHCHEPKTIRFAKHGWLLVSQGKHVVFFLNPITNQRIDLPELPRREVVFDGISFSESPTSPNCTVLAIHVQTYWVFPTFIRRGEDSWTSDPIYIESVFVGYMGQWVRVYMLDPSSMVWKETKDLGDRVLFLSRIGSGLTKTTDLQVPGLENRIYFPRFNKKDGTCAFYDLSAGKFHTSCNNHGREDYYGTTTFSDCAWIEPSYRMLTDQELDWLHKEAS